MRSNTKRFSLVLLFFNDLFSWGNIFAVETFWQFFKRFHHFFPIRLFLAPLNQLKFWCVFDQNNIYFFINLLHAHLFYVIHILHVRTR